MKTQFKDIPTSHQWLSIDPVNKGWSNDKKYHIVTENGDHQLLRISPKEAFEDKREEFEVIKKLSNLDFTMSKALDFGMCNEGPYMILTWLEGEDFEKAIKDKSLSDQYQLGIETGRILRKIHSVDVEVDYSWETRFNKKIDGKIKTYEDCPLKYRQGNYFIDYINETRHLLKDRPIALHHGDFHVGNMIYCHTGQVGIIDFNRFDYGDPWEEFNRIVWDVASSHAFATGRIDGYFDDCVPEDFFRLMTLYISSNTLSSLPWAIQFGDEEIQVMKDQAADILYQFDNFNLTIPRWYQETKDSLKGAYDGKTKR